MLPTVKFNDELTMQTSKIDDVGSDRHLSFELVAREAMSAKTIPEPTFRIAHPAPQCFCLTETHAPSPGSACGRATLSPVGRGD
jgi:hypothetical protein